MKHAQQINGTLIAGLVFIGFNIGEKDRYAIGVEEPNGRGGISHIDSQNQLCHPQCILSRWILSDCRKNGKRNRLDGSAAQSVQNHV